MGLLLGGLSLSSMGQVGEKEVLDGYVESVRNGVPREGPSILESMRIVGRLDIAIQLAKNKVTIKEKELREAKKELTELRKARDLFEKRAGVKDEDDKTTMTQEVK